MNAPSLALPILLLCMSGLSGPSPSFSQTGDDPPVVLLDIIAGPVNVCPGASATYVVSPGTGAPSYSWTLTPPIGTITGNGNQTITLSFTGPGTSQLCATPSNGSTICKTIISAPIPPTIQTTFFCTGETWTCGGQSFAEPGTQTMVFDSWLGCDSILFCTGWALPPIIVPPMEAVVCEGESVALGGNIYDEPGVYTDTLTSSLGCDSVLTLILTVLEADAIIAPPGGLGCDGASTLVLDASGSTSVPGAQGAIITYEWAGPGIVFGGDTPTPIINATGEYCLEVTQWYPGIQCTDQACVTVTANAMTPEQPSLTGPLSALQGVISTYTATASGSGPAPTGFTWVVTGDTFTANGNTIDVTWTTPGTGQVCVTADNNCGPGPQSCLTVDILVSAFDIPGLSAFELKPSLGNGRFTLALALTRPADLEVDVINALGQPVFRLQRPQTAHLEEEIDLAGMAPGVYFVQVHVEGGMGVRRYTYIH